MDKKSRKRKPRYLPSGLPAGSELYRAGMHLERQQFKDSQEARHLLLSEGLGGANLEQEIERSGLDLTVSEGKALTALQILLHRTNYQGNTPPEQVNSVAWKFQGMVPVLSLTYSEYFEAYGLERANDGRYHGAQRDEAIKALEKLEQPRRICYKRKKWTGQGKARRTLYDVIVVNKPLIEIIKGYKDLEKVEADKVMSGQDIPERITRLVINVSPLLIDGIDDYYTLKSATLYREIEELLGSKRFSDAIPRFINMLTSWDLPVLKVSKEVLAERLRLDNMVKYSRKAMLQKRLLECCETAKALGYLLEYREDEYGLLVLRLNPEQCWRIGRKRVPAK